MTATIAESLRTSSVDLQTLLELSRRTDPVGVLSIYLDARPGALRAASIEAKNRLGELQRRIAREGPPDRTRAVSDALARLDGEIERLTDPERPGRGRVLFASVGETWLIHLSSQMSVSTRVVLDDSAFIHPLLELLDEGGPWGVVLASRTEARLLEWRLGELTPLRELRVELVEPPHERSGPVGSRPANGYGTPTGEQRNARTRERSARFVERVAAEASRLGHDRGWERVLICGGEQLTHPLAAALAPPLREVALRDPRMLVRLELAKLEEEVTRRVRAAHAEYERRLIRVVRTAEPRAGGVALGLSEVVGALNQARVAHLVYDPMIRYQGRIGDDGSLYAKDEAGLARAWTADTRLTERIVERALETGARVSPVEGAAHDGLADASGIAAVLRW